MKISERIYNELLQFVESKLGKKVTYTDDLESAGKRYFGRKFVGVFTSDTIPSISNGQYAITNLDSSSEPGSHWVAIAKLDQLYFYDSFGRKSSVILKSLRRAKNTESDAEQKVKEQNCGQRCLAWLILFDVFGPEMAMEI